MPSKGQPGLNYYLDFLPTDLLHAHRKPSYIASKSLPFSTRTMIQGYKIWISGKAEAKVDLLHRETIKGLNEIVHEFNSFMHSVDWDGWKGTEIEMSVVTKRSLRLACSSEVWMFCIGADKAFNIVSRIVSSIIMIYGMLRYLHEA